MGYKYAPIQVDLSAFGDGLYARLLHPKLQPNRVLKAQQQAAARAASALPASIVEAVQAGGLTIETMPAETRLALAPFLVDQMDAQEEQLAALLLEWNVPDIYTGEPLPVPRADKSGRAVFDRAPGGIVQVLVAAVQQAMEAEVDPNS